MNASQSTNASVTLKRPIRAFDLSEHERKGTFHAARLGNVIADAIAGICSKVKRPRVYEFESPSPTHKEPAGLRAERLFLNAYRSAHLSQGMDNF